VKRLAQQQKGSAFLNLSTVSTLFSAVTATTLQYSYQANSSTLEQNVNMLWIVSLVFSLASAINSQLAYAWHTDVYRSPKARVPWWGSVVINRAPLCFLIGSVIAFSAGLVCFTFANFAATAIPIVITVCTSVSSFTLLIVTSWFVGERLAFRYSNGEMWFSDVLKNVLPTSKFVDSWRWTHRTAVRWSQAFKFWVQQTSQRLLHSLSSWRNGQVNDVEAHPSRPPNWRGASKPIRPPLRSSSMPSVPLTGRNPLFLITTSSNDIFPPEKSKAFPRPELPISAVLPALRNLAPSTHLFDHPSPIRHLAFSPNGEFLASCSWDKATIIWKVDNPFQVHRRLEHIMGVAGQVAWSPNGRLLLTKLHKSIRIWDAMV
jgi:WD repeat-containing protein 26